MRYIEGFAVFLDKKINKHLERSEFKDGLQKLGINLMTARAVGIFITHLNDLTWSGTLFIIWLGWFGMLIWLTGVYKQKGE